MSDSRSRRPQPGRRAAPIVQHEADPWWGVEPVARADGQASSGADALAASAGARSTARAPRARRQGRAGGRRDGIGWLLLGLAVAPLSWIAARIRRSDRLRRMVFRLVISCIVLVVVASSVGVILVNNVVISRAAELGKLDDTRRELRRSNAELGDSVSRLSVPPRVQKIATDQLGMVRAGALPTFVFLDGANRALTPLQRRQYQLRVQKIRDAQAARDKPAAPAVTAASSAAGEEKK